MTRDLDPAVRDLEPEGVERYRSLCEEALAAAGLNLAAGHRLWEKYRWGCRRTLPPVLGFLGCLRRHKDMGGVSRSLED